MGAAGDVGGAAHGGDLAGILDQAHLVDQAAHVADLRRSHAARARLGADPVEGLGDPVVPGRLVTHGVEDGGLVGEQRGELGVQFGDGVGLVEAEGFTGRLGAEAVAVPDLPLHVFGTAEQQAARRVAGHQHQHRLGLTEAGEVIEVAVEAVAVVGVAVTQVLRRGGDDGDAAARGLHGGEQAGAAGLEGGDVEGHGVAGCPGWEWRRSTSGRDPTDRSVHRPGCSRSRSASA